MSSSRFCCSVIRLRKIRNFLFPIICLLAASGAHGEDPISSDKAFPVRAFHVSKVTKALSNQWYEELIGQLAARKYNMLILSLGGNGSSAYDIPELGEIRFLSGSREETECLIRKARAAGLEPVLEVKVIGKQQTFLGELAKRYPGLLAEGNVHGQVLNPAFRFPDGRDPYEAVILPLLDGMIALYGTEKPKYFLLGVDEMSPDLLEAAGRPLGWSAAQVFANGVNRCVEHLLSQGITPIIWGDMLLSVQLAQPIHGVSGFGCDARFAVGGAYHAEFLSSAKTSVLTAVNDIHHRDQIIVAHWEYDKARNGQYPAIDYFQHLGFKDVWGATWYDELVIREFSRYAAERHCGGMIATTWHTSIVPAVKYLYQPILVNSIVYFSDPEFTPPEIPHQFRMGPVGALVEYSDAVATKIIKQTTDPVFFEMKVREGEIPEDAQFWLTDKDGRELCRTILQYDGTVGMLRGEFLLPSLTGASSRSLDMGFRYRCSESGYLVQSFQRAGLVIANQIPTDAEKVPGDVLLWADFSKLPPDVLSSGLLNVAGRYGGVLLLETNRASHAAGEGLDIQTLDAAYMYPGSGFWSCLFKEGFRVSLEVMPEENASNTAVLTFGNFGGGFRLMLDASGQLILQLARASDGLNPILLLAANGLKVGELNQIEFTVEPLDLQNGRKASLMVNGSNPKTVLLKTDLSDPGDAPLGFGTDFKRWSRSDKGLSLFPGKIRRIDIQTYHSRREETK